MIAVRIAADTGVWAYGRAAVLWAANIGVWAWALCAARSAALAIVVLGLTLGWSIMLWRRSSVCRWRYLRWAEPAARSVPGGPWCLESAGAPGALTPSWVRGRVEVVCDLGAFFLLRFRPCAARMPALYLPLQQGHVAHAAWHELRCALRRSRSVR